MNKKVLFALVFIISFSCIWAVWEGNGGIGSSSDFPAEGLFVRSDMFPKHTLLEITNLEKNIKARAVVIGPSGIPGLLVSLSPELGEELKVPMGKVVRMRVFTPSPVNEDGDDGKSISTTSPESQDLDTNPALFVASHSDLPNANIKNEETKPVSENTYGDTILYDSIESHIDDTETSEKVEAAPVEEDSSAETPLENTTTEEEVPNVEAILDPAAEETAESVSTEPVEEVEAPEVKPNKPPVEDSSLTHRPETVDTATEIYMEPATEKPPVTVAPISEPEPEKEAPPAPVTEISEPSEPEQAKEEIKEVEVVDPVAEPVKAPVEEKKVDTVSDVTPKNEPASDTSEDLPAPVEKISIEETPAEEAEDSNSYDETDSDIYSVTTQEKAEETSVMSINSETETVPNTLEKGKTYVQIVIYNDKYNRDETLKKYGKNYPMVVEERLIKNNTRYTIFVGPLKADETGAVLERFKQLGFKDAFIKKGK
ncbi:SPOR domain-containing protein [Treponema putidum]|uniref:SPOR domain-containing protein n=1 Tax=Treponema putidum TaxID=221027 RepID=A0ABY5HT77_9SPIR|nr:SPOR domain-containing protein [Treponema putidum]UTY28132.1 SPOR domain-containing protein [Treponema putidum]